MRHTLAYSCFYRWLVVWLIVSVGLGLVDPAPGLAAAQQEKEARPKPFRQMKYENGTLSLERGTKLRVTVGPEKIVGENKLGILFVIPARSAAVSYDVVAWRRSTRWVKGWEKYGPGDCGIGGLVCLAVFGAGVAILGARKAKKHYVTLSWQDGKREKEAVLQVGKNDYTGFLADLEQATGRAPKNLPREREQLRRELDREKDKKIPVRFDRQVRLGGVRFSRGLYQAVLLDRGDGRGELCFFRGKTVKTGGSVVVVPVQILAETNGAGGAEVVFQEGEPGSTVTEIRLRDKTLRFL